MAKNKLNIIYFKPKLKTFTNPRIVRNVTGKKIDKVKVRHSFVDTNGKIDSQRCTSIEQAQKQLLKFNIKNIAKAIFYDQSGTEHVIYDYITNGKQNDDDAGIIGGTAL